MKYHKISGIPLNVCTCEQKIAYNSAFQTEINYSCRAKYKACTTEIQRSEIAVDFVELCMQSIKLSGVYADILKKYDIDSIFCALKAGAENYLKSGCPICSSYDEICKMFPAKYLNKTEA